VRGRQPGRLPVPVPAGRIPGSMTDLLPIVEDRLGEVGVRLTQTTGGQALCRLDGHMASAKGRFQGVVATPLGF
jgi:hypothetical protein